MRKKAVDQYLEKARKLNKERVERLQSRMRPKLARRAEDKKLTELEALAIQLELEDEELEGWREQRRKLNEKLEAKKAKVGKDDKKAEK